MITPVEFISQWNQQPLAPETVSPALTETFALVRLDPRVAESRNISKESKVFLIEAGLPKSAAPFLTFDDLAKGLQRIWEVWDTPEAWAEIDRLRLRQYSVIGADSVGNPICIDEGNNGNIVVLEHADNFTSITFMNSGVPHLAEFLLIYRHMVEGARLESGENAYVAGRIPAPLKQQTIENLRRIDPSALEEGCFWRYELDVLQ